MVIYCNPIPARGGYGVCTWPEYLDFLPFWVRPSMAEPVCTAGRENHVRLLVCCNLASHFHSGHSVSGDGLCAVGDSNVGSAVSILACVSWSRRGALCVVLALAGRVLSAHDCCLFLAEAGDALEDATHYGQFGAPLTLSVLLLHLSQRFTQVLDESEKLNFELEDRVEATRLAL
ncbi:MAG: hypothetical protein ACI8Z1_001934 [Candidatus Azotimanducaceae bacterium]|jgi:hypothetical protein